MPDWVPRHRLAVPAIPAHYCDRPALTDRADPVHRLATVLMAPGGFGKTTLLAEACRRAVRRGVPVAWVTLAAEDGAAALDACLAFAFQAAGLDLLARLPAAGTALGGAHPRTALLVQALAAAGRPCVLVLDELENVADPAAVALLNGLLRDAPANLHLALACRQLPDGLDASRSVLGSDAAVLTAEDLRFSRADIARFFNLALSRRELAAFATESEGWPIALQIGRNVAARRGPGETRVARHVVGNWIAGRFWDGFAAGDRNLVLDAGLFDWLDAALLEEVLERPGTFDHLLTLPGLAGLIEPAGPQAPGVHRLHPLLREQCAARLNADAPERCRSLRRRLAHALARRGETVEAMRHAVLADDATLAGAILVAAGGLRCWLRDGPGRLAAANRYLADQDAAEPRLALVRCVALLLAGRLGDARRVFATVPGRTGDPELDVDRFVARAALSLNGCQPFAASEVGSATDETLRVAALPGTPAFLRGALTYGMSSYRAQVADFDAAVALARRARRLAVGRSAFLTLVIDSHLGQVAMARGRLREARKHFRSARRIATAHFLEEPCLPPYAEIPACELALERNRLPADIDPSRIAAEVYRGGAHFEHYAAAADIAVQLAAWAGGTDAALSILDTMAEAARDHGSLDGYLAALRAGVLADAGRVAAAERVWRAADLPTDDAACLDLESRGWRAVEALTSARVRLLAAGGDGAAAVRLERALARTAAERGLVRTLMRALALRIRLAYTAGDPTGADATVAEYLALYIDNGYARPILGAGPGAWSALVRVRDADPDGPFAAPAERLLAMGRDRVPAGLALTAREKAVLRRLPAEQDKEIAARLGLSPHGVRYRLRGIFRKLGVNTRADAVRRARALGILAHAD